MPYFWQIAINPKLKIQHFLWVCWFLCKNLSTFEPRTWKLHNPYCHDIHVIVSVHLNINIFLGMVLNTFVVITLKLWLVIKTHPVLYAQNFSDVWTIWKNMFGVMSIVLILAFPLISYQQVSYQWFVPCFIRSLLNHF